MAINSLNRNDDSMVVVNNEHPQYFKKGGAVKYRADGGVTDDPKAVKPTPKPVVIDESAYDPDAYTKALSAYKNKVDAKGNVIKLGIPSNPKTGLIDLPPSLRIQVPALTSSVKNTQDLLYSYMNQNKKTQLTPDEATEVLQKAGRGTYDDYIGQAQNLQAYRNLTTVPSPQLNKTTDLNALSPDHFTGDNFNGSGGLGWQTTIPFDSTHVQKLFPQNTIAKKNGGKIMTPNGLKKKFDAGGVIGPDNPKVDPNYRKYKTGFGATLEDVALGAIDSALSPIAPNLIKSSDYQTKFGAQDINGLTYSTGQIANSIGTGVITALNPALGAGVGAVTGVTKNIGGDDKGISQDQINNTDIGKSIGTIAGSIVGGKAKSSEAASSSDNNSTTGTVTNSISPVVQSLVNTATKSQNTSQGTDFSNFDTSKFNTDQQTAWTSAKTNSDREALLKSWGYSTGLKDGGVVSSGKAKEILRDGTAQGHALTDKQKHYFGWIAGGMKKANGGPIFGKEKIKPYKGLAYKDGGTLSAKERKALPESDFIFPKTRSYPIPNEDHARNALARVSQFGTDAEKATVRAAVKKRYPDIKEGKSDGGKIVGSGTGKSDSIPAQPADGSFIVPVENAKIAEDLRAKYLSGGKNKIASLKMKGDPEADFRLSNGEHMFTKKEVETLKSKGVDVNKLAPNSDDGKGKAKGGGIDNSDDPFNSQAENTDTNTDPETQRQNDILLSSQPGGLEKVMARKRQELVNSDPTNQVVTNATSATPVVASTKQKSGFFKNLDVEKAAAYGQLGIGLGNLLNQGKAPVDKLDPEFIAATENAKTAAGYGLSPLQEFNAKQAIERNRRGDISSIISNAGGDAGIALANSSAASRVADDATNNLAAQSEQLRLQKQAYANDLITQKAGMSRQLFADKMNLFNKRQEAGANLVSAGLGNIIGSKRYDKELSAEADRNKIGASGKLESVPFTQSEIDSRFNNLDPAEKKKYSSSKAWADSLGLKYTQ